MIPAAAIPALIALACKLGLLGHSMRMPAKHWTARLVQLLLVLFVFHNLIEIIGFSHLENGAITPLLTHIGFIYVALLIPIVGLLLHLSLRLSFDLPATDLRARLQPSLYFPGIVLLYLLLGTDQLVTGFQAYRGTMLRIPGPWYFLVEIYVIAYMSVALASLIYGARTSRQYANCRSRNRLWLLALLPVGILFLYLIIANHFGVAKITSTIYLPIPLTLFLILATYASGHRRLPDLAFFVPGSGVRRRKAALYARVEKMMVEMERPRRDVTLAQRLAETFGCPVELVGPTTPSSRLPMSALRKVRRTVVVDEIEEQDPELFALMKRHKIDAIVPFKTSARDSTCWALFGAPFVEEIYTPLDFVHLEKLFDQIQTGFLESAPPLRLQLQEIDGRLEELKRQLAVSWGELEDVRCKVVLAKDEHRRLCQSVDAHSFHDSTVSTEGVPREIISGGRTIEGFLRERECAIVSTALKRCRGNLPGAARLLGISLHELRYLIKRHDLHTRR